MALAVPGSGLIIELPNDAGSTRAVRLTVSESAREELISATAALADGATAVRTNALAFNSSQADLWASAELILSAPQAFVRTAGTPPTAPLRWPWRVEADNTVRAAAAASSSGVPLVGVGLVVTPENRTGLDPSISTLTPEESERRTWALACWEQAHVMGQHSRQVSAGSAPQDAGLWQIGVGIVACGGLVLAVVYAVDAIVEVERQTAIDQSLISRGAAAYTDRLQAFMATGVMPPAGDIELAAASLRNTRANDGWQRLRNAASEIVEAASSAGSLLLWGGAAYLVYKVVSSK